MKHNAGFFLLKRHRYSAIHPVAGINPVLRYNIPKDASVLFGSKVLDGFTVKELIA